MTNTLCNFYEIIENEVLKNEYTVKQSETYLQQLFTPEVANQFLEQLTANECFLEVIQQNDLKADEEKQQLQEYYKQKAKADKKIPATEKQINYILKLNPNAKIDINNLCKKTASKIITNLLKSKNNTLVTAQV